MLALALACVLAGLAGGSFWVLPDVRAALAHRRYVRLHRIEEAYRECRRLIGAAPDPEPWPTPERD